jgi:Domain of unknown function (DUF1707)
MRIKSGPSDVRSTRATDRDRDACVDVLNDALVSGRLKPTQHEARVGAAMTATTLADLDALTRDLVPISRKDSSEQTVRPAVVIVALIAALGIGAVLYTIKNGNPRLVVIPPQEIAPRVTTPTAITTTTVDPSLIGKFCNQLATAAGHDPQVSQQTGISPNSTPTQFEISRLNLPADPSPALLANVNTFVSLSNATVVIVDAETANYTEPNLTCLTNYDSAFTWLSADSPSTSASAISVSLLSDHGFLVAARSASGDCWYILNPDPATAKSFGLGPAPGISYAETEDASCSATSASSQDFWETGYTPPQLTG